MSTWALKARTKAAAAAAASTRKEEKKNGKKIKRGERSRARRADGLDDYEGR